MPKPTILVCDDEESVRSSVQLVLERDYQLVFARDGEEALKQFEAQPVDLVVLDIKMPKLGGLEVLNTLMRRQPPPRVLMLTVSEDGATLARALQRGASGYLLKTVDSDVLASAIERAMLGESTISPEMTGKLVSAFQALQAGPEADTAIPPADPANLLSPREQQILAEIALGASNKEIARTLGIAETTVKIHVQHILRKLNLSSRVQAAVYATTRPA